jgi:hypothetical protein
MVFNVTFNNISVISWRSFLLVEETVLPEENHWPATSHWQTLSHNVVLEDTSPWTGFELNLSGDWHWLHRYNVVVNPTTIRSRPWWPLFDFGNNKKSKLRKIWSNHWTIQCFHWKFSILILNFLNKYILSFICFVFSEQYDIEEEAQDVWNEEKSISSKTSTIICLLFIKDFCYTSSL